MIEPIFQYSVLPREFYQRSTEEVAMSLLGKLVVRDHTDGTVVLRISEVEAYLGVNDRACHTFGGRRTARTETMWGEAGYAYVYMVYGIHNCLNVVTVGPEQPEAVLIRGAVVVKGSKPITERRGKNHRVCSLVDGPGKLAQALAVTRAENGANICDPRSRLRICDDGFSVREDWVQRLPRIGVDYAGEAASWLLRYMTDSKVFISSSG